MWLWLCMSSYYLQVQSMDVFKDVFKGKLSSPNQGQNLMSNVNVEIYGIDLRGKNLKLSNITTV